MGAYRTSTGTHVVPDTGTFCKLEYPCFRDPHICSSVAFSMGILEYQVKDQYQSKASI